MKSAYEMLQDVISDNAPAKPVSWTFPDAGSDGRKKLSVKMETAPADYSQSSVEDAAAKGGVTPRETVKLDNGATEARPRSTVTKGAAVAIVRSVRGVAIAAPAAAAEPANAN